MPRSRSRSPLADRPREMRQQNYNQQTPQQLPTPPEDQLRPLTEDDVFSESEPDDIINNPTAGNGNDREDSLSDIDVDLYDLISLPDDYISPNINEDGEPIQAEDSDNERQPTPPTPADEIQTLIAQILANVERVDPAFITYTYLPPRQPLGSITLQRNQEPTAITSTRLARAPRIARQINEERRMRLQIREYQRRRQFDQSARLLAKKSLNKENMAPVKIPTFQQQREGARERAHREEVDFMIMDVEDSAIPGHVLMGRRWIPVEEERVRILRRGREYQRAEY